MEQLQKMNRTIKVVATDVLIKETTKELKDQVENIQIRLGEVERVSDEEHVNAWLKKCVEKCDMKSLVLSLPIEDLEIRSWRNNVRMVGLKEGGEMFQYVEKIHSLGFALVGSSLGPK
ncbi:hypothetical protein AMECASPLE_036707 [Ameca splendens]|uniref:Uncharacterized protein n=1 Tax=Ameca splendens TaxID=208324 RepID=A0ABV0YVG6_9TELE